MHTTSFTEPDWIITNAAISLKQINETGINMACWERDTAHKNIVPEKLLRFSVHKMDTFCHYGNASGMLKKHLLYEHSSFKNLSLDNLLEDVQLLADLFYDITASRTIHVSFSIVENDMCRKFHTDINDLRLLCTYYGPGTICLKNGTIAEDILDRAIDTPDIIPNKDTYQAGTGDVLILKGPLHPTCDGGAVLHRSPVLSESRKKRILLRIDTCNNLFW